MNTHELRSNIVAICLAKCTYSFSFSVMFVSLALFSINTLHISASTAAHITSMFLALNFGLPLIAGYLGNHYINFKTMFVTGLTTQAFGYFYLSQITHSSSLTIVLCLILAGSLVNKVSVIEFISFTVEQRPEYRRTVMLYAYACQNFGGILGIIFSGVFNFSNHLNELFFGLSFAPLFTAFIAHKFIHYDKLPNKPWRHPLISFIATLGLLMLFAFFTLGLPPTAHNYLLFLTLSGIAAAISYTYSKTKSKIEKLNIIKFSLYMLIYIIFWSVFLLTPIMLMHFIESHVNLSWHNFQLQPQWLDSIDPLIIITLAPALAYLLAKLRTRFKFIVPTYLLFGMAMLTITLASGALSHFILSSALEEKLSTLVILFYIGVLAIGELLITPEGYTLPGKFAPKKYRGLLTGAWLSSLGASSLLSSVIASVTLNKDRNITNLYAYHLTFHTIMTASIIIAGTVIAIGGYASYKQTKTKL